MSLRLCRRFGIQHTDVQHWTRRAAATLCCVGRPANSTDRSVCGKLSPAVPRYPLPSLPPSLRPSSFPLSPRPHLPCPPPHHHLPLLPTPPQQLLSTSSAYTTPILDQAEFSTRRRERERKGRRKKKGRKKSSAVDYFSQSGHEAESQYVSARGVQFSPPPPLPPLPLLHHQQHLPPTSEKALLVTVWLLLLLLLVYYHRPLEL